MNSAPQVVGEREANPDRIDIFVEAGKVRAAEIARAHGAKLARRGKYLRGACPLCGAGAGGGEPFQAGDAMDNRAFWYCHAEAQGGDAVKLEMLLGGHADRVAAAKVIAGVADRIVREREHKAKAAPAAAASFGEAVDSADVAAFILRTAQPARGEIVEAWLRHRGLHPEGVPRAIDRLRFHPRCPVYPWRVGGDPEGGRTAPAMIAPLVRVTGPAGARQIETVGVHATYLRPDGRGKAALRRRDGSELPARKMWGEARGAGFWLTDVDAPVGQQWGDPLGRLLVGEGIETVWARAEKAVRAGGAVRALAVLSLLNLQGGGLRDDKDALPLWNLAADRTRPAVTIEDAGPVTLLVDADMKPIKARVQRRRGGPRTAGDTLTGLERADICAALAVQHWRHAGARDVRAIRPPMGMDFNDLAMAEVG